MPLPPLLLVDRVVAIEGERGQLGPSRIVTEYDVPRGQAWTADGRPRRSSSSRAARPTCSWCRSSGSTPSAAASASTAPGLRPAVRRAPSGPGTTLRHDIRIDRFARLGDTTLFYFRYDCVDAATGTPVLQMRNGCAGFFTPRELSSPRGLVAEPRAASPSRRRSSPGSPAPPPPSTTPRSTPWSTAGSRRPRPGVRPRRRQHPPPPPGLPLAAGPPGRPPRAWPAARTATARSSSSRISATTTGSTRSTSTATPVCPGP